jgi:hypothetical protein
VARGVFVSTGGLLSLVWKLDDLLYGAQGFRIPKKQKAGSKGILYLYIFRSACFLGCCLCWTALNRKIRVRTGKPALSLQLATRSLVNCTQSCVCFLGQSLFMGVENCWFCVSRLCLCIREFQQQCNAFKVSDRHFHSKGESIAISPYFVSSNTICHPDPFAS